MAKKFLSMFMVAMMGMFIFASGTLAGSPADTKAKKVTMKGSNPDKPVRNFNPDVKADKRYNIAIVVKSQAVPVWESHLIAAAKAGQRMGVNILPYSPAKADNVEEQKRILEDLVTKGVDCVVLAPANSKAIQSPVASLVKKGIPVVFDNTLGEGDDYLSFVGVDSIDAGHVIAKTAGELMKGKGKLLILEGVPGQQTSDDRVKAIKEYVDQHFPEIKYKSISGHWQFDEGRKITEDTLQSWPDLNGIVSPGGNMSEGAAEAIAAAGRTGKVVIGGFDVQAPTVKALKEGKLAFTISQGVYEQAYWSVAACVKALNGQEVPRTILTPIKVVLAADADKYDESPEVLKKR
jgi:ABC-type sugar transport system substrate-binding protein